MSSLYKFWLGIRSTLFWVGFAGSTIFYGALVPIFVLVPYKSRYPFLKSYSQFNVWWLAMTCGLKYEVIGRENIPQDQTVVIMANHQSTWETLAFASIFPPLSWVLKRELLRIPFFGWGLFLIRPIAINRGAGKTAMEQVKVQGKERLENGTSLVIFPEGTRVTKGKKLPYKKGGAVLAEYAQKNVLLAVHNAGEFWPRHSYIKYPGTVTVRIGELMHTEGKTAEEILEDVKVWLDTEKEKLPQRT